MHKLIFVTGKVGSGKDTLVKIFKDLYGFEPFFYGDNLKTVLLYAGWNGKKDLKGRKLLQQVGRAFRNYDEDFWVNWLFDDICMYIDSYIDYFSNNDIRIIIGDVRHINEITRMKKIFTEKYGPTKFITIKMIGPNRDPNREMDKETTEDISETEMDQYKDIDYTIINNETVNIKDLHSMAKIIYEKEFQDS